MTTETLKTVETHPFEAAGLGQAPFRYIGMVAQDIEYGQRRLNSRDDAVSFTTKPGGSCDACGQYIVDMYRIRSADGRVSVVGCDCIKKVGYKVEALPKFKADQRKVAKVKREVAKGKEKARVDAARRLFLLDETMFADEPHPTKWGAEQGKTLRDYIEWTFCNAGHSGRFSVTKRIEKKVK